jgi:hypothetical protein
MKIRLKCLHTNHISYAVWVSQCLFWNSSFMFEATLWLCAVISNVDWHFAFYFLPFGLDLFVGDYFLIGCCLFENA